MPSIASGFAGMGPFGWLGINNSIYTTNFDLNTGFSFGASGNCFAHRFNCPITQSSGTLKVWARLVSITGDPTAISCALHAGPSGAGDAQRPSSTEIAKVTIDCSAASADTWIEFSFTSISLTENLTYWLLIFNDSGTPTSHYVTLALRRYGSLQPANTGGFSGWSTADGFATDPTSPIFAGTPLVCVIKFSDGSYIANAYAVSSAHASNTNLRGGRWTFPQAMRIAGVCLPSTSEWGALKLYQGATLLESITVDRSLGVNGGAAWLSTERTFAANTAYDVVFVPLLNSTVIAKYDAGSSPPADVSAALIPHIKYVDGTTPGSLNAENGAPAGMILIPAGLVAAGGLTEFVTAGVF